VNVSKSAKPLAMCERSVVSTEADRLWKRLCNSVQMIADEKCGEQVIVGSYVIGGDPAIGENGEERYMTSSVRYTAIEREGGLVAGGRK
jgi:hypothetical protein